MRNRPNPPLEHMGKAEMMQKIRACQFVLRDLALYLDTHPHDQNALRHFLMHRDEWQMYADAYAERFGVLRMEQVEESPGWTAWSSTPFPWEKEAN